MDCNSNISKAINQLRFPLAFLVVFIHTGTSFSQDVPSSYIVYRTIRAFLAGILPVAVPTFFLISGYLFYSKLEIWNWGRLRTKIHSRIHSLLIPYILWNTFYILFALLGTIYSVIFKEAPLSLLIGWFRSEGLFRLYWYGGVDYPYPYLVPLWYVRDLMICIFVSFPIYFLVKYIGNIYILILLLVYVMQLSTCGFLSSILFFSLGAYFRVNPEKLALFYKKQIRIGFVVCFFFLLLMKVASELFMSRFYGGGVIILVGVFAIMILSYEVVARKIELTFPILKDSSFFIFVFHFFLIYDVSRSVQFFCGTNNESQLIMGYMLTPIIISCLSVLLYLILDRYLHKLLEVILGGR